MTSFRIKVDLSEYFVDCRKESYIFVKQEWEAIKEIQGHISRLFNLSRNPLLVTGDGVYLPPEESIQILNQADTIKVCGNKPTSTSDAAVRKPKFTQRSNSTLLDHCNLPALFSTNETPIVPAEIQKKRNSIGAAQLKKSKLSINFDNPLLDKTAPSEEDEEEEDEEEEDVQVVTPDLSQKKKRKRIRKRKPKVNGSQSTPRPNNGNGFAKQNGSGFGKVLSSKAKEDSNQHTKFDQSDSESSSDVEEEVPKATNTSVKFRTPTIPNISRIIKGFRASCPVASSKSTDQSNNSRKTNAGEVADCSSLTHIEDSDEVDASDDEPVEVELERPPSLNASHDGNKTADLDALRKNLSNYPAVETLPNKNDFIGFRVLKMAENYVPVLSDYIIGLVESVDKETMAMEIVILAGNEELKQHQEGGKFSLPDCDDTLVNIDDRTLHCNWVELKDVRLVDVSLLA